MHYLIFGFIVGMIIPAVMTKISAIIVNVPNRSFLSSYLAASLGAIAWLVSTFLLFHLGITDDLTMIITGLIVTVLVYYICLGTTLFKATLTLALSVIIQILATILLGVILS